MESTLHIFRDSADWLVWLVVLHFIGDWLLQTNYWALNKTSNFKIRLLHCTVWATPFLILFFFLGLPIGLSIGMFIWLLVSHERIDTYKPLMWYRANISGDEGAKSVETFKKEFETPRGFVVNVTLDQIFHLLTLIPCAILMAMKLK